jgi:2-dehydro-3-deoxyphosphogalactonate aldolase
MFANEIGFGDAVAAMPLIAILRGITPNEAEPVGRALAEAGITLVEVPLNSPDPFNSIGILADCLRGQALVGGGTAMTADRARRVVGAGGRVVVTPHCDVEVIRAAKAAGAWCVAGVATPTEGFNALQAGADGLKLFPAQSIPPAAVQAWKAVFPGHTLLFPTGGITAENMRAYRAAGAAGFGIGSGFYERGAAPAEVGRRAGAMAAAWRAAEG